MPTSRNRLRDDRVAKAGTYQNLPLHTSVTRSVQVGRWGVCNDIVGNPTGVNLFDLTNRISNFPGLNGVKTDPISGAIIRIMSSFPLGWHVDAPDPRTKFASLTTIEKNNLSWDLLSKANPSAPDVSVPTFIAELKDIPSLMKSWYGLFARPKWSRLNPATGRPWKRTYGEYWNKILDRTPELIASGHLSWRWAVAPFIRDVRTMLQFTDLVNKRVKLLWDLRQRRVIKRRVQLRRNAVDVVVSNRTLHSEGILIKGSTRDHYTEEVWGSVRYHLTVPPEVPLEHLTLLSQADLRQRAWDLVTGLERSNFGTFKGFKVGDRYYGPFKDTKVGIPYEAFATAWELMPWSWLVDWFTGLGTVINASKNALGLTTSNACLMRHTRCESTITIDGAASESWAVPDGDYFCFYERKERFPGLPVLPFAPTYLPLLTRKAGLILGSLYIMKVRPRDPLASTLSRLLVRK